MIRQRASTKKHRKENKQALNIPTAFGPSRGEALSQILIHSKH
jgi:hypothetical protein